MSYDCPDFVDDVVNLADHYGVPETRVNEDDDSLRDLIERVEVAFTHRRDLLSVMRDVAALLPSAGRLHPDDLFKLQTRVVAAIEAAS